MTAVAAAPSPEDLLEAASVARRALASLAGQDWTMQAGDLTWDVRTTLTHTQPRRWGGTPPSAPAGLRVDCRAHDDASNTELLDVLDAAAAMLAHVARAGTTGARGYHARRLD